MVRARATQRHFIQIATELDHELLAPEEQVPVSAIALQLQLQNDLDAFFESRIIQVQLDPELVSKAAAGPTRIRLRTSALQRLRPRSCSTMKRWCIRSPH